MYIDHSRKSKLVCYVIIVPENNFAVPTFQYLSSANDFYKFGTEVIISEHTANLYHLILWRWNFTFKF